MPVDLDDLKHKLQALGPAPWDHVDLAPEGAVNADDPPSMAIVALRNAADELIAELEAHRAAADQFKWLQDVALRFHGVTLEYRRHGHDWPHDWRVRLVATKNERAHYRIESFGASAETAIASLRADVAGEDNAAADFVQAMRPAHSPGAMPADDVIDDLRAARAEAMFYRRRCEALQQWQSHMRDPERNVVCDILANGSLLPAAMWGDRYKVK